MFLCLLASKCCFDFHRFKDWPMSLTCTSRRTSKRKSSREISYTFLKGTVHFKDVCVRYLFSKFEKSMFVCRENPFSNIALIYNSRHTWMLTATVFSGWTVIAALNSAYTFWPYWSQAHKLREDAIKCGEYSRCINLHDNLKIFTYYPIGNFDPTKITL